jgi:hypothetical protein
MFGFFQNKKLTRGEKKKISRRRTGRSLRFESLEGRALLAGDVTVTLAANVLTITGDASANEVEITPGASTGEYRITGLNNTIINGPALVVDPFDTIVVSLAGGSDTFTIRGSSPTSKLIIPGDINIDNADGNNTNKLINVQLNDDLNVIKVGGTSESNLEITGTLIIGDVVLDTAGFHGDSKTVITGDSRLQGNLTVDNYDGEDHFVCYASIIDGDVSIENRDGDTRTVFGITEDPVIFGSLTIVNGNGNDKVFVHDTEVWEDVDIDNNDGHTLVSVQNSDFGLGAPVGGTGDFDVDNLIGIDEFSWVDSTVRDDLEVDHGAGADAYGSKNTIDGAEIGLTFNLDGDGGFDILNMSDSRVVGLTDIDMLGGATAFSFISVVFADVFNFDGDAGNDELYFERTTVQGDVVIDTDGGQDTVELVLGTRFLGSTTLEGGAGIDKLIRQVAPAADAVVIAFLFNETFELDEFIVS